MAFRIPPALGNLLTRDQALDASVQSALTVLFRWISDSKVIFFPEYTDHGPTHIDSVAETCAALITDESWPHLTPADGATLLLACVLHDSAMHLSEDGFMTLISETADMQSTFFTDPPWSHLWTEFASEARRFDEGKLISLFGSPKPIEDIPVDPQDMSRRHRLLIGEFLRRHHTRLAYEIATRGIPGSKGHVCVPIPEQLRELCGLVARSHGLDIRHATDLLPPARRREYLTIHVPFLMAVLRIADYVQIQSSRADAELLNIRALRSPLSQREWRLHATIGDITSTHDDPEALYVTVKPRSIVDYLRSRDLLRDIQRELDQSWSTLGEVYGRVGGLDRLGIRLRRMRSNLDDRSELSNTLPFVPREARFDTSRGELLKILIRPLYGNHPEVAFRELVQNGLDACRELEAMASKDLATMAGELRVHASLEKDTDGTWWAVVADTGVGMSPDTIVGYFLKAGASFRNSDYWKATFAARGTENGILRSGRFGIGALAAFMLGDTIDVTTRHALERRGVRFAGRINDDVLQLDYCDCPIGTTIKIKVTEINVEDVFGARGVQDKWKDRSWDFYRLKNPPVVRSINGEVLTQRYVYPQRGARLPDTWRRIQAPGFDDVQWTFWADRDSVNREIVCNGLLISSYGRAALSDEGDRAGPLNVGTPLLSIFDSAGTLPLNLQRSELAGRLPFSDALKYDVALDVVAHLIVTLPEKLSKSQFQTTWKSKHPGLETTRIGQGRQSAPWLVSTLSGWILLDEWIAAACGVTRFVLDPNWRRSDTMQGMEAMLGMPEVGYVPFGLHPSGDLEIGKLLECLPKGGASRHSTGLGMPGTHSRRMLVREQVIERSRQRHTEDWLGELSITSGPDEWQVVTWGVDAFAPPSADVFEMLERRSLFGYQEWLLDPACRDTPRSTWARVWRDVIGARPIPFSRRDREALVDKSARLREYAQLHRKMQGTLQLGFDLSDDGTED